MVSRHGRRIKPHRAAGLLVAACVALAGAGCGSKASPDGEESSASTGASSAGATGTAPAGQDELYEEAERVYRAFFELEEDAFAAGGATSLPPEMNQYTMEPFSSLVVRGLTEMTDKGWRTQPGTRGRIAYVKRSPDITREDSVATLSICVDNSQSPFIDSSGNVVSSGSNTYRLFFRYDDDGALKIYGSNGETVESCVE